ncbi:activator of Hsp90 ATPase 1 family protein [Streptomyces sp. MA5143a]|uniref:activator of Hsp90 ATPase 1 family protein n=1 Tax=Streptomyces sp. MA5143a TaxID=2083010 RepID=UPI000D1C18F8|nr:activator of Hsp90 ATPase 1 family protein [Streptomyces sp. MA5143a]SPF03058.1 hypothetical protein SMA5143A_3822 [Streptomyces sp. MA5143a]
MAATGLTQDAGWEIGVSRTLAQPPDTVWEFISGPRGLALWLGAGARLTPERGAPYTTDAGIGGEVRGYRPRERIRVTYGDTTVQVTVSAAAGERERRREHWRRVLDRVADALDAPA